MRKLPRSQRRWRQRGGPKTWVTPGSKRGAEAQAGSQRSARAKGVILQDDFAEDRLAFVDSIPAGMRASMAVDLERGNRLELDWLAGKVVALGRELGVPVPANEAVYAMLKPYRLGRPTI